MPLERLSMPGFVEDAEIGQAWSDFVGQILDQERAGNEGQPWDSPRHQFFSLLREELADDASEAVLTWIAFPKKIAKGPTPQRWLAGERREKQEEYCEWAAERDDEGRIRRVMFTTELPGYYRILHQNDEQAALNVYREHVSPDVELEDLKKASGEYLPNNKWNVRGAMHMVQRFNTLAAAITLVAQATLVRVIDGVELHNPNDLIRCGVTADIDRNSDPFIVGQANTLARTKADVSLADPLGLYLGRLSTAGWETPDGSDPRDFWKITRGTEDRALRAVYEVPEDRGFSVSRIKIDGEPIISPSQIAESLKVKVVAIHHRAGQSTVPPKTICRPARARGVR